MDRTRANDVREAMRQSLPAFVQPFLTWLTARPSNDEPYVERTAAYHLTTALAWMIGSTVLSALALAAGGWYLAVLPFTLIGTASGMGKLQAVIYHHCAHGNVFAIRPLNAIVGEAISIVLVLKRFRDYRSEHLVHHVSSKQLTHKDEFMQFVHGRLGLVPSMSKRVLWILLLTRVFSPLFHARFFIGRIASCFTTDSMLRFVCALTFWAALIGSVVALDLVWQFAVIWLIPLIPLLQIATIFKVLVEHRFPDAGVLAIRDRNFVCHFTSGVFAGEPLPKGTGSTGPSRWALVGWWSRMLTVHLLSRIFILVGDAPAHDFHHRYPASRKWQNYIHERHRDLMAGCPKYPQNYLEAWGLLNAVDQMLDSLSRAPVTLVAQPETDMTLSEFLTGR